MLEGPIASTGASRPFRSAFVRESILYVDLHDLGYMEEEYFLRGTADARDPDGNVIAAGEPYVTRLLVRRPADPSRFSGTVHLEPFHVLNEDTPAWSNTYRYFTKRGDAWIGVTVVSGENGSARFSMSGGLSRLRAFDAERYGALALYMPDESLVPAINPANVDGDAMRRRLSLATSQGQAIVADLARMVKRDDESSPLRGLSVNTVIAAGWSQTGLFWRNFLDHGHHDRVHAVDGYVIAVSPGPVYKPADAAIVHILSEAEVTGFLGPGFGVDDDSDDPRYRGYEVPGTFHHWHLAPNALNQGPSSEEHAAGHNNHSWYRVVHAVLDNLNRWIADRVPMPRAARITRDAGAADGVVRDEHGNAVGGLRTPWVDVPTARFLPKCTCSMVTGAMEAFEKDKMERLYGSEDGFRARFAARVDELVAGRWLLPDDGEQLKRDPT